MYPFRADKSNSQESFFVLLVDGTTSMNAHYPIFLKCFNNVCNNIKQKLAFQFGQPKQGSDTVLYDINTFLDHKESNFNKVFQQLFQILLTQHKDKKYLTICFISDGVEPFVFEDFLPLVEQITSVFQIQFASIAVGKNFPTQISNKLRERLHNNGNLHFPFISQVLDQGHLDLDIDGYGNVVIKPEQEKQIIKEFTDALENLKQQLIVFTGKIELNEIVQKSFLENPDQKTKVVQCNQVFLASNPSVSTIHNELMYCSQDVEVFTQIQKGSIQQLLIHLQANNKIEDGQKEFKKLLDISTKSQKLFVEINQQINPTAEITSINNNPTVNVMNTIMNQFVQTNQLVSLIDNENEYAQLQAKFEKSPQKCIEIYLKESQIEEDIQEIQLEQQKLQNHQQIINKIKLNSKLIILIDSFTISESQNEEIVKTKQNTFNQQELDNILTIYWADTIQQDPQFNFKSQQIPLTQAIQYLLNIIEQDQSGINNFTIWLIISGQHEVDFQSLSQKQQQILQQKKLMAFTTMIIENDSQNNSTKISQQKLSLELRRQLHTNYQTSSLQVSVRIKTQEFQQYLNQYFRMIKEYQSIFYKIQQKGCYVRGITRQKNAMFLLNQFINDIVESRQQLREDTDFIQNVKQIKQKYYKILYNFREREFPNETYYLTKLNTIFELIDKINLQNHGDFLDQIFNIKLGFHDRDQKIVDINQLNKVRNIIQNKNNSKKQWNRMSVFALIAIYLIQLVSKRMF